MTGKLEGKIAIVTGGNSGIGEATVHAYAREGASVAIMARRSEEGTKVKDFVRNQGGTAEFIEYVKTVVPWLRSVGGTIIAKDVNQNSDLNEWDGGQLGVIVEFESKAAAQRAFNSLEFQEYIKFSGIENQLSLSIIG